MEGTPKQEGNIEDFSMWKELRESAPERAHVVLMERGLSDELETLTIEEAEHALSEVTALIEEFSVKNENRYLVREFSVYQNQIKQYLGYKEAPQPAFRQVA